MLDFTTLIICLYLNLNFLCTFQLLYPAYTTMLGHLRCKALENFKIRLENSLKKGEGFASSVRACSESSIHDFEQGCAGNVGLNLSIRNHVIFGNLGFVIFFQCT